VFFFAIFDPPSLKNVKKNTLFCDFRAKITVFLAQKKSPFLLKNTKNAKKKPSESPTVCPRRFCPPTVGFFCYQNRDFGRVFLGDFSQKTLDRFFFFPKFRNFAQK